MKKVLIITDSLGLPRLTPEKTEYEETYPYLLSKKFLIMHYSKGGGTIMELYEQVGYFKAFEPDYVILQSGIVDCAPRPYPFWLQQMSKYLHFVLIIKGGISFVVGKSTLRRIFGFRNTYPSKYRKYLRKFKNEFPNSKFFALGIMPASVEYENELPTITRSIIKYNNILKDEFGEYYINMDSMPFMGIMSDHHHLNKEGHEYVCNAIIDKIKYFDNKKE